MARFSLTGFFNKIAKALAANAGTLEQQSETFARNVLKRKGYDLQECLSFKYTDPNATETPASAVYLGVNQKNPADEVLLYVDSLFVTVYDIGYCSRTHVVCKILPATPQLKSKATSTPKP